MNLYTMFRDQLTFFCCHLSEVHHVPFVPEQHQWDGIRRRGAAAATAAMIPAAAALMLGTDILELLLHDLDVIETIPIRDGIDEDEAVGPENCLRQWHFRFKLR